MLLSRIVDVILSIPQLIFALIVLGVFGSSIPVLIADHRDAGFDPRLSAGACARHESRGARIRRGGALRGEGLWWIIRREILPNALAPLISEFGLRFCFNFCSSRR